MQRRGSASSAFSSSSCRPTSSTSGPATRRESLPTSSVRTSPDPVRASSLIVHSMTRVRRKRANVIQCGSSLPRIFPLPLPLPGFSVVPGARIRERNRSDTRMLTVCQVIMPLS